MKKLIVAIAALILLLFTACIPETPEPPYGVWVSEEPRIVLYFKPEYRLPVATPNYLGIYTLNDVDTKVFARFGNGLQFAIYDLSEPRDVAKTGDGIWHSGRLIAGTYRLVRDEIHYIMSPYLQEQLGVDVIVFRQVEDYEPINSYYWFPNFFPRSE